MANIKKIKLSDGSVYSIFDEGALRLNDEGKLITGNGTVDSLILDGLYIVEIDDVPVENSIDNVVTAVYENGRWVMKRRSTDLLLKDIGGTSHSVNGNILNLTLGKERGDNKWQIRLLNKSTSAARFMILKR